MRLEYEQHTHAITHARTHTRTHAHTHTHTVVMNINCKSDALEIMSYIANNFWLALSSNTTLIEHYNSTIKLINKTKEENITSKNNFH